MKNPIIVSILMLALSISGILCGLVYHIAWITTLSAIIAFVIAPTLAFNVIKGHEWTRQVENDRGADKNAEITYRNVPAPDLREQALWRWLTAIALTEFLVASVIWPIPTWALLLIGVLLVFGTVIAMTKKPGKLGLVMVLLLVGTFILNQEEIINPQTAPVMASAVVTDSTGSDADKVFINDADDDSEVAVNSGTSSLKLVGALEKTSDVLDNDALGGNYLQVALSEAHATIKGKLVRKGEKIPGTFFEVTDDDKIVVMTKENGGEALLSFAAPEGDGMWAVKVITE